jgi:Kef-type K+ transport system membrane component KefB
MRILFYLVALVLCGIWQLWIAPEVGWHVVLPGLLIGFILAHFEWSEREAERRTADLVKDICLLAGTNSG